MTNITPDIANVDSVERMPRRDFIRKSLVASGGVFVGMALGEKMNLPELYYNSSTSSSSGSDGGDTSDTSCTAWFCTP